MAAEEFLLDITQTTIDQTARAAAFQFFFKHDQNILSFNITAYHASIEVLDPQELVIQCMPR